MDSVKNKVLLLSSSMRMAYTEWLLFEMYKDQGQSGKFYEKFGLFQLTKYDMSSSAQTCFILGAKAPLELVHVKKKNEWKILEQHRFASVVSDDLQCCQILSDIFRFSQILSNVLQICKILSNIVQYCFSGYFSFFF